MLEKLIVKNYKSLRSVEVPLKPLTVFVGPNASGKSNIMDSLEFLRCIATRGGGAQTGLQERHGYKSVVWGGQTKEVISLEIRGALKTKDAKEKAFSYSCALSMENEAVFFASERIASPSEPLPERIGPGVFRMSDTSTQGVSTADSLFIAFRGDTRFPLIRQIALFMESWAFYHLSPREMRQSQPVQEEATLKERGENLNTVLHTLFSGHGDVFREIEETVRAFLPEVRELRSPLSGNLTYASFVEEGLQQPIPSWAMSDGSLFCLALAVALFAPEPPGLLAVEAPDTELHPYVMEQVADALKAASRKTQVLITTHSPFLLRYLPPESLVIVEKVNGETGCTPVKDKRGAMKAIKLLGVDEAFLSGHLGGIP